MLLWIRETINMGICMSRRIEHKQLVWVEHKTERENGQSSRILEGYTRKQEEKPITETLEG